MVEEDRSSLDPDGLVELALRGEPDRFEAPGLLKQAHQVLTDSGHPDQARRLVPLIFALSMHPVGPESPRFTPFMTGSTEDGTPWGWPDLSEFTADDWTALHGFVRESRPAVAARIADLIWENKREFSMAEAAFENYLEATAKYVEQDWISELTDALGRAGALAGYAKREEWADRVVAKAWELIGRVEAEGNTRAAKRLLDVLLESKGLLPERLDFVAVLKKSQALQEAAAAEGEDAFIQQAFLEQVNEAAKLADDAEAADAAAQGIVELLRKQAAERESTGSAMVAAALIEEALKWCATAKVSKADMDVLRAELQRLYAASGDEAHEISATSEIPREQLDRLVEPYRGHTSAEIVEFLSQDPRLLPSEEQSAQAGRREMTETLTSIFAVSIFHGDYKVAQLNTEEEKLEHYKLKSASVAYQLASLLFLAPVFEIMAEQDPSWPGAIHGYFADVPWLKPWRIQLMDAAVGRLQAEDYVSAMHILVFWVEGCLRDLLAAGNAPIIAVDGVKRLRQLIEIAGRMDGIDADLVFFIDALLNRRLGTNLRNHVAHALLEPDDFNRKNVLLVLLAAIRLGSYRLKPSHESTDSAGASEGSEVPALL